MSRLLILQGLPASGKSTYAKKLVDEQCAEYLAMVDADFEADGIKLNYWDNK